MSKIWIKRKNQSLRSMARGKAAILHREAGKELKDSFGPTFRQTGKTLSMSQYFEFLVQKYVDPKFLVDKHLLKLRNIQ